MFMSQTERFCFVVVFVFVQTFNTIKKLRESSSTSPVAETEGTVMEEVKQSCGR